MTQDDLTSALVEVREQEALEIVDDLLANGKDPGSIIDACRQAMTIIGARFEANEAFIPELIMAGEIMSGVSARVKPYLSVSGETSGRGRVVLGTVKGDIHDIGKDIVGTLLAASGFDVVDLGVDVPTERFVEAVRDETSCTVALSCLLTTGFESMKTTIAAFEEAGLRDKVSVMVGGAPVTQRVCEYTGADGWGDDAASALRLAAQWQKGGAL
jgi:5-methyltetrahydrofolate--homocysteine methyltransferase